MNPKIIKILVVIGGLIIVWFGAFLLRGNFTSSQPQAVLEFWNVFDKSDDIKPLLKKFTQDTGIRVNYRSFTDLQEYRDTLLLELAAGEGPDVFAIHQNWIPKYRSLLTPLPSTDLGFFVENVHQDFVDVVASSVILKEEIPESDREKGREANEGIFALPMYLDTLAFYFNKSIFRNVLSKPYPAPALTWEGVYDDTVKLSVADSDDPEGFKLSGIALGRADNILRGVDIFYTFYHQLGGEDLTNATKENQRDSNGKAYQPLAFALEFITSFSRNPKIKGYSWNSKISADAPEKEIDAFVRGKVAMMAGYSYTFETIKSLITQYKKRGVSGVVQVADVEIAPFPQVSSPQEGNPKTSLADFFALTVAKTSRHPHASWQLILELTNQDSQKRYHELTGKPTSRRDLIEEQKKDPLFGVFAEQAVYADTLLIFDDKKYAALISDAINSIADGTESVSNVAKKLATDLQD